MARPYMCSSCGEDGHKGSSCPKGDSRRRVVPCSVAGCTRMVGRTGIANARKDGRQPMCIGHQLKLHGERRRAERLSKPKTCNLCGSSGPFRRQAKRFDGLRPECVKCQDEYGKRYAEAHEEQIRNKGKQYRAANAGVLRAKGQEFYQRNREKIRAYQRATQHQRYLARYEKAAAYRRKHAKKHSAYVVAWQRAKPHLVAARAARRSARIRGSGEVSLTHAEWVQILEYHDHRCAYCLRKMKRLEREHVIPVAEGGAHTADNIVPACRSCNARKSAHGPLRMLTVTGDDSCV